ncbi:hypothetical protein [Paenibacillus planticolens]|nr:hypothetical protein [Paenibacillus planticolens]
MLILISGLSFSFSHQAFATIDLMANSQLVVLSETKLLDDYKNPNSVAGSVSGIQMLRVACSYQEGDCLAKENGKEYIRVKTWMGEKWIEDDNKITAGGYWETERDITIVNEMNMYDHPNVGVFMNESPQVLKPQKVHVTAKYQNLYKGAHTGRAMLEAPIWYRISTDEFGEKWIENPFIPEDVIEQPSDMIIKFKGNELLYDYPFVGSGKGVQANAGLSQLVSRTIIYAGVGSTQWYKVQLDDGTFKWALANLLYYPSVDGPLTQFDLSNEKIKLRTATRYFDIDGESGPTLQNWLQPGDYVADKINNGWARIQTPYGWKVVNLDRAPLERPHGITETKELVKLTPETTTYYFPLTGEVCHVAGTFTFQDAQSFEKWISPQGVSWYHISTYSGIVWLPENPIPQ